MLAKLNVQYVIVGHSERRQLFGETDETVNKKLEGGAEARDDADRLRRGDARGARGRRAPPTRVAAQTTRRVRAASRRPTPPACVVAYEPIWAIGTGRNATPDDANDTIGVIRGALARPLRRRRPPTAIRIQYGGSVKSGNAAELMAHARDRRRARRRRIARSRRVRPHRPVPSADPRRGTSSGSRPAIGIR